MPVRSSCPVALALDLFGDRWTLLVIRDLLLGRSRFKEFAASAEGIPTNILTDRLTRLVESGVIEKVPAADGSKRLAYTLTRKGRALEPVVAAIRTWSRRWEGEAEPEVPAPQPPSLLPLPPQSSMNRNTSPISADSRMNSSGPLLITAFGPFGGRPVNASSLALGNLRQTDRSFNYRILPVDRVEAPRRLRDAVRRISPRAILLLGEAAGARCIRLETQAWNELDFSIPDILGRQPQGRPIARNAPARLPTCADVPALQQALTEAGHPAELSEDPGRYLCNQVYFTALHRAGVPAILVHLPLEERLPTARATEAIRILAAAL